MLTISAYDPSDPNNPYTWEDLDGTLEQAFTAAGGKSLGSYFPSVGELPSADWDLASTIVRLKAVRDAWAAQEGNAPVVGAEDQLKADGVDLEKLRATSTIRLSTKDDKPYVEVISAPSQEGQKYPQLSRLDGLIAFCEQAVEHEAELATEQA